MLKWILPLMIAGFCAQAAVHTTGNTSGNKDEVCPLLDNSTIFEGGVKRKVLTQTASYDKGRGKTTSGKDRSSGNEQQ